MLGRAAGELGEIDRREAHSAADVDCLGVEVDCGNMLGDAGPGYKERRSDYRRRGKRKS